MQPHTTKRDWHVRRLLVISCLTSVDAVYLLMSRYCFATPFLKFKHTPNPTNGYCAPMPTQRAIPPGSVNEYQRKLGSIRAYHVMYTWRIRGLAASAGVRLRA